MSNPSPFQSRAYLNATRLLVKLGNTREHIKTFRPSFLVMTGHPSTRPDLVTVVAYVDGAKTETNKQKSLRA
jgi:hypothetical protein